MRGFCVGRFQPFHNGHLELLKNLVESTPLDELIIAIANVEQERTRENPFSFVERAWMIRSTLSNLSSKLGLPISLVPLPYISPSTQFVPSILDQFGPIGLLISNNDWVRAQFQNFSSIRLHPKLFYHREQYRGRRIRELMEKGTISWKYMVPEPVAQCLLKITDRTQNPNTPYPFFGEITAGMGVGARYVETPHFFNTLAQFLGAEPFLGTLNLRLQNNSHQFFKQLRSHESLRISPRVEGNVSYWNVDCYPAILKADRDMGKKCYVLALDFGAQKSEETIVELVAHPHLRNMLDLKDGDIVAIRIL